MFEKEIKFIVDYSLNKLRKEVAHVNIGRLLNSSIHPALIKYCSAEITNQIKNDRNKLLTESFFDYSGKEISKYFNLINEEIKQNYKMKSEDLKKLIIKAVSFNVNYVVRPGWTLAKFIFNEEKERSVESVLSYFDYIYYYDYQIKVLSAFIEKRKIDTLSKEEFIMITSKIDKEIISQNRKEILKDGVTSIADFFNEGGLNRDKVAPYLIEYYLKDKKFTEAVDALRSLYEIEDKQKQLTREVLLKLSSALKEDLEISEVPERTESPETVNLVEEVPVPAESIETDFSQNETSEEIKMLQFGLQDLMRQSEELSSSVQDKEEDIPAVVTSSKYSPGGDFVKGNLIIEESAVEEELEQDVSEPKRSEDFSFKFITRELQSLSSEPEDEDTTIQSIGMYNLNQQNDIFNFLNKRDIDKIVENVFREDQNEFAGTMEKITGCRSYDEASAILKKVFQNYRINPYSKDAVMLTSAVANYFNQV
jgi:hypothetical protein